MKYSQDAIPIPELSCVIKSEESSLAKVKFAAEIVKTRNPENIPIMSLWVNGEDVCVEMKDDVIVKDVYGKILARGPGIEYEVLVKSGFHIFQAKVLLNKKIIIKNRAMTIDQTQIYSTLASGKNEITVDGRIQPKKHGYG